MPDARPNEVASANDGSAPLTDQTARTRFSLRTAFLLIAAVAVILAVGGDYVMRKRAAQGVFYVRQNLKSIGIALDNYELVNEFLPRDVTDSEGNVLSSWRFVILPYLESWGETSYHFDSAWNAPSNRPFAEANSYSFCWNRRDAPRNASVFAVTGANTAFDGTRHKRGDVPPDVILLMEVRDSKTHWMQPGDYNVADLLAYRGKIGDHLHGLLPDRLHVLFADGEVWALSPDAPMTALHPFLTIAGAESHDRETLLGPQRVR